MPNHKILIIEDDATNSELFSDLLTSVGHTTIIAGSAEEGIALARSKAPDLALMDLALPGMDGLSATRLLKSDPRTRNIPVIAITAHAVEGAETAIRLAGCCCCIAKPIDTRRFSQSIDEIYAAEQLLLAAQESSEAA